MIDLGVRCVKVWGKKWILITASLCYMGFLLMLHRIPRFTEGVHGPLVIDRSLRTEYGLGIPSYIDVSANLSDIDKSINHVMITKQSFLQQHTIRGTTHNNSSTKFGNKDLVTLPDSALKELASGLMKYPRPTYIKESRNPCFYVDITERVKASKVIKTRKVLYCLPLVYLAGFAKAGSSDLHQNIIQHQHIIPGNMKEPQYWFHTVRHSKRPVSFGNMLSLYHEMIKLVATHCVHPSSQGNSSIVPPVTRRYQNGATKKSVPGLNLYRESGQPCPLITLDSSPMYMFEAIDWEKDPLNQHTLEPKILVPHKLHHFLECPKIIVLMRNPVERLFSDFRFFALGKNGSQYFHRLVQNGIIWWNKCVQTLPPYKCAFGRNYTGTSVPTLKPDGMFDWGDTEMHGHNGANRVRFSIYVIYIMKWLEVFPRKCFLFVKTEEYNQNPIKVLTDDIFPFLELETLSASALTDLHSVQKRGHVNKTKQMKFPMLPQTRQLLQDFYKPYNEQLVSLLNDTRFRWF